MGDFIVLLGHLNLSPVNSVILAVILFLIYRLFDKLRSLEATTLKALEDRLDEHDTHIAVNSERLRQLEAHDE